MTRDQTGFPQYFGDMGIILDDGVYGDRPAWAILLDDVAREMNNAPEYEYGTVAEWAVYLMGENHDHLLD